MTAVIIPFPVKATTGSQFEFWKDGIRAKHPEWDAAHVERMALLCLSVEQRVKRRAETAGGDRG